MFGENGTFEDDLSTVDPAIDPDEDIVDDAFDEDEDDEDWDEDDDLEDWDEDFDDEEIII